MIFKLANPPQLITTVVLLARLFRVPTLTIITCRPSEVVKGGHRHSPFNQSRVSIRLDF